MCLFHSVFLIVGHSKNSLKATEVVIFSIAFHCTHIILVMIKP